MHGATGTESDIRRVVNQDGTCARRMVALDRLPSGVSSQPGTCAAGYVVIATENGRAGGGDIHTDAILIYMRYSIVRRYSIGEYSKRRDQVEG